MACRSISNRSIDDLVPGMRVLDCISMEIVPSILGTIGYAILSYVWGDQHPGVAECQDILVSLPNVVDDAILLARRLGMRCL
jgi:hypothetical protein